MKLLLCAVAFAASTLAAADTASPLDRLVPFAGTWKSDSETFDTPYSKPGKSSSTLVNQCWKAGRFFVCNQSVDGASRVLLVFAYKDGDTYGVTYVPADGSRSINGTVLVVGGMWTYPGQQTKLGQTTYFRTVNIYSGSDSLDYREEYSQDQQTWTLMARGHETRVRNPATVP